MSAYQQQLRAIDAAWSAGLMSESDVETALRQADATRAAASQRAARRFTSRQAPRSPDRQASRDRRRMLGGSSALPPDMRRHYTEGLRAVLCIVAGEVKHHGVCDLPIDRIAALAGVCRTTAQTALHEARRLGHLAIKHRPRVGQRSLPNLVTIASEGWRAWLRRAPTAHRPTGSKTKILSTTKSIDGSSGHRRAATEGQTAWKRPKGTEGGALGVGLRPPIGGGGRGSAGPAEEFRGSFRSKRNTVLLGA